MILLKNYLIQLKSGRKKKSFLRNEEPKISDPQQKYSLKEAIEECEERIKELETKLERLHPNKLITALLCLNFNQQTRIFEDFLNDDIEHKIASFLIHGEVNYCQDWLVKRLVNQFLRTVSYDNEAPRIIPINKKKSISAKNDIEDLWEYLAKEMNLGKNTSHEKIIEKIYHYWHIKSVIIIFYNLGNMYETEPKKIIENFWNPLIEKIKNDIDYSEVYDDDNDDKYLLMFMIDNHKHSDKWGINFIRCSKNNPFSNTINNILKLPENTKIKRKELNNWFSEQKQNLPKYIQERQNIKTLASDIWKESKEGIPEITMQNICSQCNCRWPDIEKRIAL